MVRPNVARSVAKIWLACGQVCGKMEWLACGHLQECECGKMEWQCVARSLAKI